MSVVKVIELMAESGKSWEDATQMAVTEAAKSVENIRSVWVKEMKATVENNKVSGFRVSVLVSFVVK